MPTRHGLVEVEVFRDGDVLTLVTTFQGQISTKRGDVFARGGVVFRTSVETFEALRADAIERAPLVYRRLESALHNAGLSLDVRNAPPCPPELGGRSGRGRLLR